ncbi:MAG: hypothetical protein H0X08_00010 [Blastocatellia bacterium]|nr:hypothetical protein [Blastocatellia bacterium]
MSWSARTKDDLIIEVWEKLDCEDVGAVEIEAIETAVAAEFGDAAIDSPMVIARLLADEGAELRHSELMDLYVRRAAHRPYAAALENLIKLGDLREALTSLRSVEQLRRQYASKNDAEGGRQLRKAVLAAKDDLKIAIDSPKTDGPRRAIAIEISQWLSRWLQTPALFETWVGMRIESKNFVEMFGKLRD